MDKNTEWFTTADLSAYQDEYVAIARGDVVTHGEDPETVYTEAQQKLPGEEVVLWKVPRGEAFIFVVHAL